MSITPQRLAFRPARNVKELESLFRLRYQGYLESQCASLVTDNQHGFELDVYDHYAHHIGLFQEGNFGTHPIGYLRLVQEHAGPLSDYIDSIASHYGIVCPLPEEGPGLPLLSNCLEKATISEHMNLLRPEPNGIVKASHLCSLRKPVRAAILSSAWKQLPTVCDTPAMCIVQLKVCEIMAKLFF